MFFLEAGEVDDPTARESHLLVRIAVLKNPALPAFMRCDVDGALVPRSEVLPRLHCPYDDRDILGIIALDMAKRSDSFKIHLVRYTWEATNIMKVIGLSDVTDSLGSNRAPYDPVIALLNAVRPGATQRRGGRGGGGRGRGRHGGAGRGRGLGKGRGRGRGLPEAEHDPGGLVVLEVEDVDAGGEAAEPVAAEDALGDDDEGSDVEMEVPAVPLPDLDGRVVELDLDVVLGAPDLAPPEPLEASVATLPLWNSVTGQVTDRAIGAPMGRIKEMHVGTPREAVSVYCRLHQCTPPLRRAIRAPPQRMILEWFERGLADRVCDVRLGTRLSHEP